MRKLLCGAFIAIFACMSATFTHAFERSDNVYTTMPFGAGGCRVELDADYGVGVVEVYLFDASGNALPAGRTIWVFRTITTFVNAITRDVIASCLGVDVSDVTGLEQNGADGDYLTDNYAGFKFTLLTAAGGLAAGEHEYKVGSGSLGPPANDAPTADAGPDQSVPAGTEVTLAGSGTDSDGIIASYAWVRTGGTGIAGNATLSDDTAQSPTFTDSSLATGDAAVTHIFSLTVTDDDGASSVADTVTITITPPADTTPPTITINALSGPVGGTYSAAINLSEDSIDFTVDDLSLVNASASLAGSGKNYIATLTPLADGEVKLSVAAATFTDAAGNANIASNEVTAIFDGTAPTVVLSGAPESADPTTPFTVAITFSETVTGFDSTDITVANANVTALVGTGPVYVATLLASGTGPVSITVPANAAVDLAGNGNLVSNEVTVVDETIAHTQELIAGYMRTRTNQLIRNQPELTPFLSGAAQGSFALNGTPDQGYVDFSSRRGYPVWMRMNGSWTNDGNSNSRYVFGALGAHQFINENVLLGGMVQFDYLKEETAAATVSGTGWMAGPYFVAKSANHPLYVEGRLLYGETNNQISPYGSYQDSFDTTRFLAQVKVAGDLNYNTITLTPFLDASYVSDEQHSYVDSLGNTISEQNIELGQVALGLDFNKKIAVGTGKLELWGGVSGIWSQSGGQGAASTIVPDYEGTRAQVELGINRMLTANQKFDAAVFYDGIGAAGFESYGLRVGYELKF